MFGPKVCGMNIFFCKYHLTMKIETFFVEISLLDIYLLQNNGKNWTHVIKRNLMCHIQQRI